MARFKVVVTDQVFPDTAVEQAAFAELGWSFDVADGSYDDIVARAHDADALLNTYVAVTAELMDRLPRLQVVARYGIGVDNVDLAAATDRGVVVTNVPDYCVDEVATHALALILDAMRRVTDGDRLVRAGGWGLSGLRPIRRASDWTVGLVGFGRIARRLAQFLAPLGCTILVHDPYVVDAGPDVESIELDGLLRRSDLVSLHVPATDATRHLIGGRELELMRPDAVLVNTSRGALVDTGALVDALRCGRIRAAAIDVLETEPPPAGLLDGLETLLVTPHMAYYSEQAIAESQQKATSQIVKVLTGKAPDYQVNKSFALSEGEVPAP
ncbi:C-terminal binding protein [Jiangella ureilytica]|uniref:C-terminal binding protein n=1 Tax=Jiangella ureilytica TaxID=2530374 RepID=UPI0013A5D96F|nr:C-terminal binding protein [Jiangella ureilytica]